mgnify:CR=1 FL=1
MVDSVKTVYCAQSSQLRGKQDSQQQAGADGIEAFVSRWDAERITPDIEKIKTISSNIAERFFVREKKRI